MREYHMKDVCFWSVGNGDFASMVQGLVRSFRRVGMDDDFIAFCDRPIEGAETILIPGVNKKDYLFKFHYLRMLQSREYKTFVFLDADSLFVRKPPPLLPLMCGSPVHAFFESDCSKPALRKSDRKSVV